MLKWLKNLKYYKYYKQVIRENELELSSKFRLRRDYVNRLYTVVNLSNNTEDSNNIKKYGSKLSETYITTYIKNVDSHLYSLGLNELVGIGRMEKLDEMNYLVVFRFSLFDTIKVLKNKVVLASILIIVGIILLTILN